MKVVGIICEYNPFHRGHWKQLRRIRDLYGENCAIVCLMSGNFVQRGEPAIFDKSLRARAAIDCGADLVLELPVTRALSSAEGFAAGGVKILAPFCDALCFGTEHGTAAALMATAAALGDPEFTAALRSRLDTGISFPAARAGALEDLGLDASLLRSPNDILAVEYCKAILAAGTNMEILPIPRPGRYHDTQADPENPSATALRLLIREGGDWLEFLPEEARDAFSGAAIHTREAGERAILAGLRSMRSAEFEALPYGSEGLWRKFMHAARRENGVDAILAAVKSKRYTHTRLTRMMMCAYLGITKDLMEQELPYTRVLGFSQQGREALKKARQTGTFLHTGEDSRHPYQDLERKWEDLYGLFRLDAPDLAGMDARRRVYIPNSMLNAEGSL